MSDETPAPEAAPDKDPLMILLAEYQPSAVWRLYT